MADHRQFRRSVRRAGLSMAMAMAAAGIVWTLRLPDNVGAQSGFNGSSHSIRPSGRRPVARVIAVSGPVSVHWNGRSRPLAAGAGLDMAVRAAISASPVRGVAEFEKRWIEVRKRA